jgi:hypothetical protein
MTGVIADIAFLVARSSRRLFSATPYRVVFQAQVLDHLGFVEISAIEDDIVAERLLY